MRKRMKKKMSRMDEAPVGGQNPAAGSSGLGGGTAGGGGGDMPPGDMMSLIQTGALKPNGEIVAKLFAPLLIPKDARMKKQIKDTFDLLNKSPGKDAAVGSFLAMLQNMMNTPQWLSAGKKRTGNRLAENVQLVKVEVLRKKINEHFQKHPKAKVLVIKSNLFESNGKSYFRIERNGDKFNITEVKTNKQKFIIEQDGFSSVKDVPQDDNASEDQDVGLDQEPSQEKPEKEPIDPNDAEKTPEEKTLEQALEGKPIKSVDVEHHPEGSDLVIQTADTDIPTKVSFHKDGKVILYYKNRPHILKKG
jgi:hypothetical protein